MAKIHELHFALLPLSPYSSDLAPSDFDLFADLKTMLIGKIIGSNVEVISEDKSFYKNNIKTLWKRWDDCIGFEKTYVDK